MNANLKRKPNDRDKLARRQQEEALDDALDNTFPASDPVSIEQPTPPAADRGWLSTGYRGNGRGLRVA